MNGRVREDERREGSKGERERERKGRGGGFTSSGWGEGFFRRPFLAPALGVKKHVYRENPHGEIF